MSGPKPAPTTKTSTRLSPDLSEVQRYRVDLDERLRGRRIRRRHVREAKATWLAGVIDERTHGVFMPPAPQRGAAVAAVPCYFVADA
ncbi:hypothetical protein BE21_01635 [Sorangium cellulosum]|uniref:Uncharacterized protein n=1 Tax=Sorangium cellulosum TaxID=56 RepID=A0A150TXY1_SORCE|nr:hypothetical protein BE21_01635 [Sorangium cellulosum]